MRARAHCARSAAPFERRAGGGRGPRARGCPARAAARPRPLVAVAEPRLSSPTSARTSPASRESRRRRASPRSARASASAGPAPAHVLLERLVRAPLAAPSRFAAASASSRAAASASRRSRSRLSATRAASASRRRPPAPRAARAAAPPGARRRRAARRPRRPRRPRLPPRPAARPRPRSAPNSAGPPRPRVHPGPAGAPRRRLEPRLEALPRTAVLAVPVAAPVDAFGRASHRAAQAPRAPRGPPLLVAPAPRRAHLGLEVAQRRSSPRRLRRRTARARRGPGPASCAACRSARLFELCSAPTSSAVSRRPGIVSGSVMRWAERLPRSIHEPSEVVIRRTNVVIRRRLRRCRAPRRPNISNIKWAATLKR